MEEIDRHIKYLKESGELEQRRRESVKKEIFDLIQEQWKEILSTFIDNGFLNKVVTKIIKREEDPYTVVGKLSNTLVHSYTQGGIKNG